MRARTVAAGLVIVAVAGSIGIVFAQKGLHWPVGSDPMAAAAPPAATTSPAPAPASSVPAEPRRIAQPVSPVTDATATVLAQVGAMPRPAAAPPPPPPSPAAVAKGPPCTNPNALGTARIVEIDTTGGPGFGFEHFKQHDFLRQGEVVLTFDDGPWLGNTPAVLRALADECVKATFFAIGKHATYYPDILRQVHEAGHSVGSHTWSHANLAKKSFDEAKEEIEKGVSAVKAAIGAPIAPFFRFPQLRHPPEIVAYLGDRNVAIFSTDLDSFDFKIKKPDQIVQKLMEKLKKHGKGIVLMHDFQHATANGLPALLTQLKQGGYKVVHLVGRTPMQSLPEYDAMLVKNEKLPTVGAGRPTSSVVRTVAE